MQFSSQLFPSGVYHPFQNHYTHKIAFFSNYLGRYSYSFRARRELFSVTVTVLWVWREYVFTVTVRYSYIKKWSSELFSENYSYSYKKKVFLGCRKWGCNKWGLEGCLAALPGNRPKSAFSALFLPFSPFSGGCEEHLGNPENGGKMPFSSDILRFA